MDKLSITTARALIDFAGKDGLAVGLAEQQLRGTVALHNMLAEHNVAYLADEVGMGKTYIALGVVALMRRFQPALRVLYLLPKNNVRDKWRKDYRSFIDKNYLRHDCIVKGFGNEPAAPYRLCKSLADLMQAVATDSARDFFICASAFSLHMGGTREELLTTLSQFRSQLPQAARQVEKLVAELEQQSADSTELSDIKKRVKQCWAGALNAMLPQFDLVVVDEAHNYRRGLQSADRNQLLATVLGTENLSTLRAQRVLLLSATPFDRDIKQLQRQLKLFAKDTPLLMPEEAGWRQVHAALLPFMVRRLNTLDLDGKAHTRNMYRTEHRSGQGAEIQLGLKQQLFAALLQKKVSESLNENHSGKFELGMLASLESYLPAHKGKPVQFDGLEEQASAAGDQERDVPDRNAVEVLVSSYQKNFHAFPPHPKMDQIASRAAQSALEGNKKQLIFVRRVASVGELKAKIEDEYNHWIGRYLAGDAVVTEFFGDYLKLVGDRNHGQLDDEQRSEAGNVSSFFSWFYRGDNERLAFAVDRLVTTPANYRTMLASSSMMFATNWSELPGMPDPAQLDFRRVMTVPPLAPSATRLQQFEHGQHAYLSAVALAGGKSAIVARRILAVTDDAMPSTQPVLQASGIVDAIQWPTFWEALRQHDQLRALGMEWTDGIFDLLASDDEADAVRHIRDIFVHCRLAAAVCRLDHPFVDLYSLRASRGKRDDGSADDRLIAEFVSLLLKQSRQPHAFSSYTILRDLCLNLSLVLKQNFEEAGDKKLAELTAYFTRQLQPLSPVLGATGENSASRSAIARKFRMPGYPRVLISTDVFQEGEDLHTFCDSVIHYGISASPIALEQKVGRVDRIASMAHRSMHAAQANINDHFIQVVFPHIRESLEFLQVRQAARNLNQFLLSMNKVGDNQPPASTTVDLAEQLRDRSPIEEPLAELLKSPFEITDARLQGKDHIDALQTADEVMRARIGHVQSLVESALRRRTGADVVWRSMFGQLQWDGPDGVRVAVRGARGRPHLLLSVTASLSADETAVGIRASATLTGLRDLQKEVFSRIQFFADTDVRKLGTLAYNAEIYAGGASVLSGGEVLDLCRRVAEAGGCPPPATAAPSLPGMIRALCGKHGAYRVEEAGERELDYHFELGQRRQRVRWGASGNYVLLTAQILSTDQTAALLSAGQSAQLHTVRRNAVFDIVDFHIDENLALAVRALHPLSHLDHEELDFTAYLVATEADRLLQILTAGEEADEDAVDQEEAVSRHDPTLRRWAEENNAMCIVRDLLSAGPMSPQDLIRQVAYGLGYQRAVAGISQALEGVLRAASRRGIVVRQAGMVHLLAKSIADYDDGHLREQFLAALSRESAGWIEREDSVRAFARWMGYARTGPVIAETGASLIRKLLRSDRLVAAGTQIRRHRG